MVQSRKRGQAALEFLTTYGWAFLVILVMISALGYFGILNPDRFLPERCNVPSNFACEEYALSSATTNNTIIVLRNQVGQTLEYMNITSVFIRGQTDSAPNCTNAVDVSAGSTIVLSCDLSSNVVDSFGPVGSKARLDIDMEYKVLGNILSNPISAQVYATVRS